MSGLVPVPKMIATALGGAAATLIIITVEAFGVEVPSQGAAALAVLTSFAAGYLKAPAGAGRE